MRDLLEYIVKNLVSKPDSVLINEESGNGEVSLILTVDPLDMGLIIGKGGQTIHSIRKILTVRAIAENVRVNLQLSEPTSGSLNVNHDEHTPETEVNTPDLPARLAEASAERAGEAGVKSKPTENTDTSDLPARLAAERAGEAGVGEEENKS